jgi:hypothetical protein
MNKMVAFGLFFLVLFASHSYAALTLRSAPINAGLAGWIKTCKSFGSQTPDLKQFFGCPTIEKFTYADKSQVKDVAEAVNRKLKLKLLNAKREVGVKKFIDKFEGDFSGNYDLVREVEESAEEIAFNEKIEQKFGELLAVFSRILNSHVAFQSAYYDENASWNGNYDGKPVEAEALVLIDTKEQTVYLYSIGYYSNDKI